MRFLLLTMALSLAFTASAQTQDQCRQKMQTAAEDGIITNLNVDSGGLNVTVDEGVWRQVDYNTKIGIVRTASCMVTENPDNQARIVIRSNMTNRILGEGYPSNFEVR